MSPRAWGIAKWLAIVAAGIAAPIVAWRPGLRMLDTIAVGAWRTSLATGSPAADGPTRSYIALTALLALERRETVYFIAETDDSGALLNTRCDYEVSGRAPRARWWSITAYGADDFLIPNPHERYSFNSRTIGVAPDGTYKVVLGPRQKAGNWLPTGEGGGRASLVLRLYNPHPVIVEDPRRAEVPSIRSIGDCR